MNQELSFTEAGRRSLLKTCGSIDSGMRFLLALCLLTAAALKLHKTITDHGVGQGWLENPVLSVMASQFETMLGLSLLTGTYTWMIRRAAAATFSLFAVVALTKWLRGEASCGCFGNVAVSPAKTLVFDLFAVAALTLWRPKDQTKMKGRDSSHSALRVLTAVLVISIAVPAVVYWRYKPTLLDRDGNVSADAEAIYVNVEEWVGMSFPLFNHIEQSDRLVKNCWIVLLYHLGCPKCDKAIWQCVQWARDFSGQPDAPLVALVEVPQGAEMETAKMPMYLLNEFIQFRGRLIPEKRWFVETPTALMIRNGIVIAKLELRESD